MPTVTWGFVQGRKEKLVSRVIICDYLKSLGIIPDELEHLELPSTVEVMRERVEFLQKLGLTIDDINAYPSMLGCSVRKNMLPVLGYLEKIGIQRSRLGEFIKNYPRVLNAKLLGFKLEGTMSTSVAYLVSIGVNPRDIGPMVTQYPYFLGMRVGTVIKPLVDYLVSLGLPKKVLARMFEKRAYITWLKIDSEGFAQVIERMPQIASLNQHGIMKPVEFLLGRGILAGDVAKMVVKCPQLVALQVGLMKNSYYFFKSEMGKPVKELVEFPEYFTYSLESRIRPRLIILKTESVGPSFCMGGKLELPENEIVSDQEDESDDEKLYRRTVSL
ncbi:hypothetical protein F0562_013107 [Nyssa sinensis]|uniref:Uncharacterized protein n=1 Tax=Nyssa sinensis TaxID=561372 RepID=A0A5J4ZYK6_9ASTE|nr:hypothetical protein F0562_013107 [Nyssa sinensis]